MFSTFKFFVLSFMVFTTFLLIHVGRAHPTLDVRADDATLRFRSLLAPQAHDDSLYDYDMDGEEHGKGLGTIVFTQSKKYEIWTSFERRRIETASARIIPN